MLKYMLRLPGVQDPEMEDGTTAFFVALARENCDMLRELLSSFHNNPKRRTEERERDYALARAALSEPSLKPGAKRVLEEALGTPISQSVQDEDEELCEE